MKRTVYTINGALLDTPDSFYDQVYACMTKDIDFTPGHNLDAFADVLRGGFGRHRYGEPVCILWENFSFSRKMLGDRFVFKVVRILLRREEEYDCVLKIN